MKKLSIVSITLAVMFLTGSCSLFEGWRARGTNDDSLADERMSQIMDAIANEDIDGLKAAFSQKALDEADNIDDVITCLFDLFRGNESTWERLGDLTSREKINYGKVSRMIQSIFVVEVDDQAYKFFLFEYPVDTIEPENEGLYALNITILDGDDKEHSKSWKEIMIPGIYLSEAVLEVSNSRNV